MNDVPDQPVSLDDLVLLQRLQRERMIDQTARQQDAWQRAVMKEHYGDRYQVEDAMPVNLNSPTVTNHYHQQDEAGGAGGAQRRKVPWWVKAGLGAALLATGAGGAVGVPLIWNAITQQQQVKQPPEKPPPTNTNTNESDPRDYFLKLGE